MFKKFLKIFFAVFCITGILYLALPGNDFPDPPPDSLQSQEPADLETSLRRGYFTNLTREEVLSWYERQFDHTSFLGIRLPTILLNYPPENAQTLIRDQTGSTFLQEFVHPFRESLYINGLKPPSENNKPTFFVEGKLWQQKIIIRYVPSSIWIREGLFIAAMAMAVVIYNAFAKSLRRKNE